MSERQRAGDAAEHAFATGARIRLADAARHLVDAVLTSEDADDDELRAAVEAVEALADELHGEAAGGVRPVGRRRRTEGHYDFLLRSPIVGDVNPLAPPLAWTRDGDRTIATGVFGAAYEGPPGYVHGGWIALAFDEVLGMANIANRTPGMTGKLSIRYRRPTPLMTPVRFESWTERVEGRRITCMGTLDADDQRLAEAEGLFIAITSDIAGKYFGTGGA